MSETTFTILYFAISVLLSVPVSVRLYQFGKHSADNVNHEMFTDYAVVSIFGVAMSLAWPLSLFGYLVYRITKRLVNDDRNSANR